MSRATNPTFNMQFYNGEGTMYQAKWKDRVFSITSNTIRPLTELGTNYKVKKKTDNTSQLLKKFIQ